MDDASLVHLKGLKSLAMLGLNQTPTTDAGLVHLKEINTLTFIVLTGTTKVTADGVAKLAKALPGCKIEWDGGTVEPTAKADDRAAAEWALSAGGKVTIKAGPGTKEIAAAKDLPAVPFVATAIDLTDARDKVTDAGLTRLNGLTALQALYLRGTKVTDAGLVHVKGLTNLAQLSLTGTAVTDAGLAHLKGLAEMRTLGLAGTRVTDAGLDQLPGLEKLTVLDLANTTVTAAGVAKLAKALPKCKITWTGGVIEPAKK